MVDYQSALSYTKIALKTQYPYTGISQRVNDLPYKKTVSSQKQILVISTLHLHSTCPSPLVSFCLSKPEVKLESFLH